MKRIALLPVVLMMTFASGCFYELRDDITDCKINMYNHLMARAAYQEMDGACMDMPCRHSFKEGFYQGYKDVANGGTGCVPAVPQIRCCNHMWMDCMCTENEKMEAWYDGYEFGAMAAKAEGMGDANRIVTRVPMATPVEYAPPGSSAEPPPKDPTPVPEAAIPPAPMSESEAGETQQTRRLPESIFE